LRCWLGFTLGDQSIAFIVFFKYDVVGVLVDFLNTSILALELLDAF